MFLNEISAVFHNRSSYNYYLIIKKLANKFEEQPNVLRKTQKTTKLFWLKEKRKKRIALDSKRFMASSLLVHYQFIISESPKSSLIKYK